MSNATATKPAPAAKPIAAPTIVPTPEEVRAAFLKQAHKLRPDALDQAKGRLATLDAEITTLSYQRGRSDSDWPTRQVCKLLDGRVQAGADVATLEAVAEGKDPDTTASQGPCAWSAGRLLELFATAQGYNGLAWLRRQAEAMVAEARRTLEHEVPAGIQFPVAAYLGRSLTSVDRMSGTESVVDYSQYAGDLDHFESGALPLVRKQLEAERRLAALEPALVGLKKSLPGRADSILKALGGLPALIASLRESAALSGANSGHDDLVEDLRSERAEVEAELQRLAGVGASGGLVAKDLETRRDNLTAQLDARVAEVRAGYAAEAEAVAAEAAKGDFVALAGIVAHAESQPRAFPRGASEAICKGLLEVMLENAQVWRGVLEKSTH